MGDGPRYLAPTLEFVIAGRPLCGGCNGVIKGRGEKGVRLGGSVDAYKALIRLSVKQAMLMQGWSLTKEPIYISLIVCVGIGSERHPDIIRKMYKGEIIPNREPRLTRLMNVIVKTLKGIVYAQEAQIAGEFIIKRYAKEERVEVLIGAPRNYKELTHDIRNS